ncbi:flagellar hook protein FlgE [Alkalilacustris brevis]|uniref:flagellar hook protein FlgE n=1 Tax=Alkalilacustris brevis TaxID=2026338 RepID=UPI000E0D72E6|nr:flagellar hook-basal body complex protein [Alkalilacustris brevis]
MTLSSSFGAGVAGLNTNATRLATISDNIANSSTFGYKRAQADFRTMVINSGEGTYSAGGVKAQTMRLVDERGPLISTANPTDLAVNGRGMLPVASGVAVDNGALNPPAMLTTTGSFRPDANGYLRSEANQVLMGIPANADGSIPAFARDSTASLRPVNVNLNQFVGNPTTRMLMELNLPATDTRAGATGEPYDFTVEYFNNLGMAQDLSISFTPTVPATGESNEWALTVTDPENGGATLASFTLQFADGPTDGGTLQGVLPAGSFDPATGAVQLPVDGKLIDLVIGGAGGRSGITQLSDRFTLVSTERNGSAAGNLVSVEVDAQGMVNALYDNAQIRTIYQIPVIDVPNPNGLTALDDQAFRVSGDSGPMFLWDAGTGPTGSIAGYAREESTTDVAAELTQMIQTQRAYSTNAKVIQAVDEMVQETTNIKR